MNQLAVRPGRNAARQAKKLKEIQKTKGAILWHEKERKKRQEKTAKRWESKQYFAQRDARERLYDTRVRKALKNAKSDWLLGPLRTSRNTNDFLTAEDGQAPSVPVHTQEKLNESRVKRGLEPIYPLVVEEKKYFHIVKGDRVVLLKGKDKGKIGFVESVLDQSHQVVIKGLNTQYWDSRLFKAAHLGSFQESEVPVSFDDIRLVIPYEVSQQGKRRYTDVVVEKIHMERHTTGIDPYTGTDYGNDTIPENHQYDPETGLPIFNRYIAGTRQRIEWPWEQEQELDESEIAGETSTEKEGILRRTLSTIRHPITSLKSWRAPLASQTKDSTPLTDEAISLELDTIEQRQLEKSRTERPRSDKPTVRPAFDVTDTTRNIIEGAESMSYTLIAPPFPPTLGEELRTDIHDFTAAAKKDTDAPRPKKIKRSTPAAAAAREVVKAQQRAAQAMKTPMQMRWEVEQARKLHAQKKSPLVQPDALLLALGEHMLKNGVRAPRASRAEEVD